MSKPRIVRYDPKKHKDRTDWPRVNALTDLDIAAAVASDPDAAPLLDDEWFRHAKLAFLEPKVAVSIRLERGVVDWFKAQGPRYQTRINAVLRGYVEAHKTRGARKARGRMRRTGA
ncbi:MAG: BrnA antitoxin family protein [Gemmatimonadales bacterium]